MQIGCISQIFAAERTFQLVTQVAGRTGRGDRPGRVVVQTFTPEHPAIQAASRHDYIKFAKDELINRRRFNYPPFGSVGRIIIRGPEEQLTESVALALVKRLEAARTTLGVEVRILCPAPPPISLSPRKISLPHPTPVNQRHPPRRNHSKGYGAVQGTGSK